MKIYTSKYSIKIPFQEKKLHSWIMFCQTPYKMLKIEKQIIEQFLCPQWKMFVLRKKIFRRNNYYTNENLSKLYFRKCFI